MVRKACRALFVSHVIEPVGPARGTGAVPLHYTPPPLPGRYCLRALIRRIRPYVDEDVAETCNVAS
jgi:hypothetical protein